jgi:hypothetical protein
VLPAVAVPSIWKQGKVGVVLPTGNKARTNRRSGYFPFHGNFLIVALGGYIVIETAVFLASFKLSFLE